MVYSDNDELVTKESIIELDNRIKESKGVEVLFSKLKALTTFLKIRESLDRIEKYIKEKTALI